MTRDSEFIQRVAKKWKFLDDKSSVMKSTQREYLYSRTRSKFHEKQKELARIEQSILKQANDINTSSDLMSYNDIPLNHANNTNNTNNQSNKDHRTRTTSTSHVLSEKMNTPEYLRKDQLMVDEYENNTYNTSSDSNTNVDIEVAEQLNHILNPKFKEELKEIMNDTNFDSSPSDLDHVNTNQFTQTLNQVSPATQKKEVLESRIQSMTERFGLDITKSKTLKSPGSTDLPHFKVISESRPISSLSPTLTETFDESPIEFSLFQQNDDDAAANSTFLLPQTHTKVLTVPKFKTLHPLANIEECVDIPTELKIPNYLEDPAYTRYRVRLAEYAELRPKPKSKAKRAEGYGVWFVSPKKWNEHMKSLKKRQLADLESQGDDIDDNSSNNNIQQTSRIIASESAKKTESDTPQEVPLPLTVHVTKSHLPPISVEKQRQLEVLHASRRFKEYLIRTHATIPEWLSRVPVSEHVIEEAKQGSIDNTAIPAALRRSNFPEQSTNTDSSGHNLYSSIEKEQKSETPMQRNFNDLRYISRFVHRLNSSNIENTGFSIGMQSAISSITDPGRNTSSHVTIKGKGTQSPTQKRDHPSPMQVKRNIKELKPEKNSRLHQHLNGLSQFNEEQHPDLDSRPRRSIPLSTMIRLTTERRKQKAMKQLEDAAKAMYIPSEIEGYNSSKPIEDDNLELI